MFTHLNALRQLKRLDTLVQQRIKRYMATIATLDDPRSRGKALKGKLGDLWRYRVGDYRIVAYIHDNILQIEVVRVGHRSNVYDE